MVARMDPERAAGWALENRNQAPAYDAPRNVTEQWGLRDGRAALEWVRNNPPPTEEMQYQACREGFKSWFSSNRADAVAWLDSETLTAFHDPAIEFYAKEIGMRTPEKAVEWCERVHDDERGTRCLKRAAALWYKRDAVAAETWLQQSPLDEETRSEVRAPLTPTQKVERRKRQRGQPPP
jgi:hypothetical protein